MKMANVCGNMSSTLEIRGTKCTFGERSCILLYIDPAR
jgi:hypothetical protein